MYINKTIFISLWLSGVLVSMSPMCADSKNRYAISGATIFDGTGKPPIKDAVILIADDKIVAVGPRGTTKISPDVKVIDARGKWIVPGLIDSHIHFLQSGGLFTRPDMIDLRRQRSYADEIAWLKNRIDFTMSRYLCSGVTSVVDMGGSLWTLSLKDRFSKNSNAPRIRAAGPLLSDDVPKELAIDDPSIISIGDDEATRQTVRKNLQGGADFIKLLLIKTQNHKTGQSVDVAINEAHKQGFRVAVHATELSLAKSVVKAGADILVHSVFDEVIDDAFLKLLKAKRVIYIPTLFVDEGYRRVAYKRPYLNQLEKTCGDPEVIATWAKLATPQTRVFGDDPTVAFENLRRVAKAGIRIAAGSDAGNIGSLHGPTLHRELELMIKAGLSPMSVLLSATRDAAFVFDPQPQIGTLKPGNFADLLILNGDPLKDIGNLSKIDTVIKSGHRYKNK